MNTITDRVAKALQSEQISVDELGALWSELRPAQQAAQARLVAIHPGDQHYNQGQVYRKTLVAGDSAQVDAIREEFRQLKLETERLDAQCAALERRRTLEAAREAQLELPSLQADLIAALDRADSVRADWANSLSAIQEAMSKVTQARAAAGTQGGEGCDVKTVDRLIALVAPVPGAAFINPAWRPDLEAKLGVRTTNDLGIPRHAPGTRDSTTMGGFAGIAKDGFVGFT